MAETGVSFEWLVTGQGKKFESDGIDIMKMPRKKLVARKLYDSGLTMFDRVFFRVGLPLPSEPICVQDEMKRHNTSLISNFPRFSMANGL